MNQRELIHLHRQLSADAAEADDYRRGHYEHLLLSLGKVIESHGPTDDYCDRVSSASPTESSPLVVPAR